MSAMLDELRATHDIVIVDAPPVLPVADALVLVGEVDAVVLVTKVGETTRERLKQAAEAILQVRGNLVGIVPNAVVQREDSAYAYAYRNRSRSGVDSLTLYTKQARTPEIDVPSEALSDHADVADLETPAESKRAVKPVAAVARKPRARVAAKPKPRPRTAAKPAIARLVPPADETPQSEDAKQQEIAARIAAALTAAASEPDATTGS
jgi:hypothetical protein